ncbi:MAG: flagellar biosynthetic protein FliO [Woeseiaceae bacterium]|nr:flagellar biosynthetic protein FliO [Woeseiaceae bacterium]
MDNPVIQAPEVMSIALSLLVIVGSVIALGWLYSRLRLGTGGAADVIDVVASRGLGPKERIVLVRVGDKQLVVGVTANSMATLCTLETPVVPGRAEAGATGFAARLRAALPGDGK